MGLPDTVTMEPDARIRPPGNQPLAARRDNVKFNRFRTIALLLFAGFVLTLTACGGSSSGKSASPGSDTSGSSTDPLAILKATKYIFFDASAFNVSVQGGGVFVTFHEPAPVSWQGVSFSSSPSWTYTTAGQNTAQKNVEQKITLSGEMAADGKSIKTLTLTETYTVTTADLGTTVTHLEFANIPNTSISNEASSGRTWLATSKLPAARSLLVGGTYTYPSAGTEAVRWEGGDQGISVAFSEKPQKFELQP